MSALLQLENVTYAYPGAAGPVLSQLEFSLDQGQHIGLIGPNGCGKTTLLHLAMGLIKPDSGRVLHMGRGVETDKDWTELRRNLGLVFQNADDQLFSPTVIEDVAFGPLNLGQGPDQALETARAVLRDLGLEKLEDRVTHKLSGGEKRLVSLATVLAMRPRGLLMDEPTNDLDPDTRARLIEIVRGLDMACLIVSHDWDFLAQTTDPVLAMELGRVRLDASVEIHHHAHAHPHGDVPHAHGEEE